MISVSWSKVKFYCTLCNPSLQQIKSLRDMFASGHVTLRNTSCKSCRNKRTTPRIALAIFLSNYLAYLGLEMVAIKGSQFTKQAISQRVKSALKLNMCGHSRSSEFWLHTFRFGMISWLLDRQWTVAPVSRQMVAGEGTRKKITRTQSIFLRL